MGVGGMSKEAQEFQTTRAGHIDGMASVLDQHVKGVAAKLHQVMQKWELLLLTQAVQT